MRVHDPSGQAWRVSRRWVPWRRRLKGLVDGPDLPLGLGDDLVSVVIGVLCLVFLFVAAVAGLELLLLLLVFPFAVAGRVLLGRHWTIEIRRGWKPYWEREVGDWQQSSARMLEIQSAIRDGRLPPQTIGRPAVSGS